MCMRGAAGGDGLGPAAEELVAAAPPRERLEVGRVLRRGAKGWRGGGRGPAGDLSEEPEDPEEPEPDWGYPANGEWRIVLL